MGGEGIHQNGEYPEFSASDRACIVNLVDERHKGGDGRVELESFDVLPDLLDGLVEGALERRTDGFLRRDDGLEVPVALDKAAAALDARGAPGAAFSKSPMNIS